MKDLVKNEMVCGRFEEKSEKLKKEQPKVHKFVEFIVTDDGKLVSRFPSKEYERHLDLVDYSKFKGNKNSILRDTYLQAIAESGLGFQQKLDEPKYRKEVELHNEKVRALIDSFRLAVYKKYCPELDEEEADKIFKAMRSYVANMGFETEERLFYTMLECYNRIV